MRQRHFARRDRAAKGVVFHPGDSRGIKTFPHHSQGYRRAVLLIQFREILRKDMIANTHADAVFPLFQSPLESDEYAYVPQCHQGIFVKQALPLSDEIGDVCRVLDIVLVPAAIQELTVVLYRDAANKNHHPPALDQVLRKGLVIVRRRLDAENDLRQAVLDLDALDIGIQLFKSLDRVVKDQVLYERFALRRAEKSIVFLFCRVKPDDQILF